MRILLIADWMSNAGGAESYIVSLRDALRAAGDEVTLLVCGAARAGEGIADSLALGSDAPAAQALLQIVNPFAVAAVRRTVREFRPDVALVSHFAYHLSPAIVAPLRRVPTIVTVMDYKFVCPVGTKLLPDGSHCTVQAGVICWRNRCVSLPHWMRDRPRYALLRSALAAADRVLCASHWVQRELTQAGIAADVVPLPVPPPGPGFRHVPAAAPSFVYCGRLSREKGVDLLIRAFARLAGSAADARLRIVGDGPQRLALQTLVDSLGARQQVALTGYGSAGDVERELSGAWALVAPSLWAEPYGLVAVEAMVRRVPVIASADGGFGETVEPGITGLLFPNGDEDALLRCLRDVAERRAFADHALPAEVAARVSEAASPRLHVQRLHAIFADVAREKARSRRRP